MTGEDVLAYCLAKPGAWQDEPWEGDVVAGGRQDLRLPRWRRQRRRQGRSWPTKANEWLARYPDDASVMAYIGRSGWNTLRIGGAIPDDEIYKLSTIPTTW